MKTETTRPLTIDPFYLWLLGALFTIILALAGAVSASSNSRITALENKKDQITATLSDLRTEVALLQEKSDNIKTSQQLLNSRLDTLIELNRATRQK